MAKFQRTKFRAYVCLGKRQKSKQKYRRATGRHNKTRQKWKSRPPMVEIGYKNKTETRGLIEGKKPITIFNANELENIGKDSIVIIGKIGDKNRLEIAKQAESKKIKIYNLNTRKFIRKMERKMKKNPKEEKKK